MLYTPSFYTRERTNFKGIFSALKTTSIMEELDVFIGSDQPTTCPTCGNRTEIVNDFILSQQHKCFSTDCNFQFMLEFENES
jgi:hypothetical protein